MNGKQIGIKLADGSFYPILEEEFTGRKKLVVTTARDNQDSVQIDLFRGRGERADQASYLGSLMIENIHPAPKKEPEIEVLIGLDPQGNLEATASDALSGQTQSLSLSLPAIEAAEEETPFEEAAPAAPASEEAKEFEESLLTGETYPIGPSDRRKEHLERRKRSPLLLILFIILGLALVAGAAYLVYRLLDRNAIPALRGGGEKPAAVVEEPALPAQPETAQPQAEKAPLAPKTAEPAATAMPPAEEAGIWYRIKWGDTLWDLAATYYRNPWLYPNLAAANKIPDPDLIIAGRRLFIPKR